MERGQVLAVPVLKQVHVVTRHGSRTPLPKDVDDTISELAGGSILTPLGQKQHYDVGVWLRQTYNINKFLEYYNASEVRLESSDLDRTIASASALSLGLFPYKAQAAKYGSALYGSLLPEMPGLPIYSMKERNDIYFRAYYGNCPVYEERLEKLYESQQWKAIEANNQGILKKLAPYFPNDANDGDNDKSNDKIRDGVVVMKQLWNYYDMFNVARTECIPNATVYACISLGSDLVGLANAFTDTEFEEVESLAATTETMKFGLETANNLLGSQLLWRMLNRTTTSTSGKFFLYSAHAPTLLSLLSTLQEEISAEPYPDYASAIIMEVYQETRPSKALSIRFVYKPASQPFGKYISMAKADCEETFHGNITSTGNVSSSSMKHCRLNDFLNWAKTNTIVTPEDWCMACENESADVCLQYMINKEQTSLEAVNQQQQQQAQSGLANKNDKQIRLIIAGTFFGGFFVGLIFMGIGHKISQHRAEEKEELPNSVKEMTLPTASIN